MTWLFALALVLGAAPTARRTVVTSTSVEIIEPLVFAPGSDRLPAGSDRMLGAIASTMDGNPSLRVVAIEAEVSPAEGRDAHARTALGLRRAAAVRARLIALGVAPARLVARAGTGPRAVIELVIVDRSGDAG
jgi:outer membrane protein OmpA-like peptidoglycan-associated protein